MSTKHTPGPWKFAKGHAGYRIYCLGPERALPHAMLHFGRKGAKRGQSVYYYEHPDDLANASLIAAAPDLLAALQRIAVGDFAVVPGKTFDHVQEIARAAIAKAEGK